MNDFYLLPVALFCIFILILLLKNVKPMPEGELENIIKDFHEKEKTLNQMNFLISEVGRISKEKTKAIKASDWDHLKKLHEEEDKNRITFDYLSNKN
jgi:hypothetical protein